VTDSLFRLVCAPAVLTGSPEGWAVEMLQGGEVAVLLDAGGLDALDAVAHTLDATTVSVLRTEATPAEQERTVMTHADGLALVWVAPGFGDEARAWAEKRGPMTLLVEVDGALPEDERHRIERFVTILSGQAA
jgi:poly-gamma-glutamate capsule biosynthesis protein CapA/YwtB (metallophosphatase superfamily)